ncbi:hypothetical protein, partial [Mesorhizobium sp. M7A.F.Ca.US.001.04.1.1]|uniref:hypothetical protein n=1 Tax=Mesorhizobium sp. M7A.F.Ca.US.001.04.1.1 TaxID=2496726 RepID=UPI0019D169F9
MRVLTPACGQQEARIRPCPEEIDLGLLLRFPRQPVDLGQRLPVGRLRLHGPLLAAEAPMSDAVEFAAVEPSARVQFREMQHPSHPPDFLDVVFAGTLRPWRPALAWSLRQIASRMVVSVCLTSG